MKHLRILNQMILIALLLLFQSQCLEEDTLLKNKQQFEKGYSNGQHINLQGDFQNNDIADLNKQTQLRKKQNIIELTQNKTKNNGQQKQFEFYYNYWSNNLFNQQWQQINHNPFNQIPHYNLRDLKISYDINNSESDLPQELKQLLNDAISQLSQMIKVSASPKQKKKPIQQSKYCPTLEIQNENSDVHITIKPIDSYDDQYIVYGLTNLCESDENTNISTYGFIRLVLENLKNLSTKSKLMVIMHEILHVLGFNYFNTPKLISEKGTIQSPQVMKYINSSSLKNCFPNGIPVEILHHQKYGNYFAHLDMVLSDYGELMSYKVSPHTKLTKLTALILQDMGIYQKIELSHLPDLICEEEEEQQYFQINKSAQ